jgi:putative N6-adenine-specific DNA methylase
LYATIGERLKHAFVGGQAWILSYRDECFDQIGLKPTRKIAVLNGELECSFREYEIFDGKYVQFRESGEGLSKDKEQRKEEKPKKRVSHDKWLTPEQHRLAELERYEKAEAKKKRLEEERLHPELKAERQKKYGKDREDRPYHKDWDKKPFGDKRNFKKDGDRKPFRKDGEGRPFKKEGDRPFRREGGNRPFDKKGGPRKESYPERKKREMKKDDE